jgi:hypothetical protein
VMGYAPQYTIMLAPLGALPIGVALVLCWLITLGMLVAVLLLWLRGPTGIPTWGPLFLLSIAVFSTVRLNQMMSVIGLAGLSLAIWAQRRDRWWLVGVAGAVGLARTSNALPVLLMIAVTAWGRPRRLLEAVAGAATVLLPLTALSYLWDANWIADYAYNLSVYNLVGPVKLAHSFFGMAGTVGLEAVVCAVALALAWPCRGKPLDLDRAALGMALGVLAAVISTYYVAIFALPALIRVARRPGLAGVAWFVTAFPWLVVIAAAPAILDPHTKFPTGTLTAMVLVLVGCCYPLFRSVRVGELARL